MTKLFTFPERWQHCNGNCIRSLLWPMPYCMAVWFCMYFFLYIFLSSYSFLKTYSYYTHIEIYNNKNSERSRIEEWTTMALLNFSPQATDPLSGGERSSMQRAHNKRKQNGSYLFFISMWMALFFFSFCSLFLFQPTTVFLWMKRIENNAKIWKVYKMANKRKAKACTEKKWLVSLSSFVLYFSVFLSSLPKEYYEFQFTEHRDFLKNVQ